MTFTDGFNFGLGLLAASGVGFLIVCAVLLVVGIIMAASGCTK